jgi:hypothetical protein
MPEDAILVEEAPSHRPALHQFLQRILERPAGRVLDQGLHDLVAAARIRIPTARDVLDPHRRRVGGRHAVEDLHEPRERRARRVAEVAGHAHAAGHAQQAAQRHRAAARQVGFGDAPGGQVGVDVAVEIEAALLYQAQRRQRRGGLGQRGGLVERAGRGAGPMSARPGQLAALDERDAHRRDVERSECLTKVEVLRDSGTAVRTDDL